MWNTLLEEIEDLGKNHVFSVQSQLRRMLLHLIKMRIQAGALRQQLAPLDHGCP